MLAVLRAWSLGYHCYSRGPRAFCTCFVQPQPSIHHTCCHLAGSHVGTHLCCCERARLYTASTSALDRTARPAPPCPAPRDKAKPKATVTARPRSVTTHNFGRELPSSARTRAHVARNTGLLQRACVCKHTLPPRQPALQQFFHQRTRICCSALTNVCQHVACGSSCGPCCQRHDTPQQSAWVHVLAAPTLTHTHACVTLFDHCLYDCYFRSAKSHMHDLHLIPELSRASVTCCFLRLGDCIFFCERVCSCPSACSRRNTVNPATTQRRARLINNCNCRSRLYCLHIHSKACTPTHGSEIGWAQQARPRCTCAQGLLLRRVLKHGLYNKSPSWP